MHIDFNATEYLEKLQKKGIDNAIAIEMLKDETDRFLLIEKAIEQSKKEIKDEIEKKQLATKDDIEISKLELKNAILENNKLILDKLDSLDKKYDSKIDAIDKKYDDKSDKQFYIIITIVILASMPKIIEVIKSLF